MSEQHVTGTDFRSAAAGAMSDVPPPSTAGSSKDGGGAPLGIIGGDTRAEREFVRRGSEAEAKMRGIIEQQRRAIGEQRAALEKKWVAEQAEANRHSEEASELRVEISRESPEENEHELKEYQATIEGAEANIWDADAKLAELRRESRALEENYESERQTSKCMYKLMLGMTGVRWDTEASTPAGYVALDKATHFDFPADASRQETADKIWEEIEASLLPSGPSTSLPRFGGC